MTIGVSAGPPQVAIPNVEGMGIDEARQKLMKLGFDLTVNRFGPFNKVFAYSPHDQATKGSTITLDAGFSAGVTHPYGRGPALRYGTGEAFREGTGGALRGGRGKRFAAVRRRWLTSMTVA